MTNEQIIMNTRVRLMRNGVIGTTGKKMEYVDDGLNIYINDSDDSYIRLIEGLNMKTLQKN